MWTKNPLILPRHLCFFLVKFLVRVRKIIRDILSFPEYWKYIRVISMSFITKYIHRFFYFYYM